MTLIDRLTALLGSAMLPADGAVPPAAVLWTDAESEWVPLLPVLRSALPAFYAYGQYNRATLTGPAIWLKCIVDRTLPEAPTPDQIPVIYLPGVKRRDLLSPGDCPRELQPLAELHYRGRPWHQSNNGSDWTVRALLVSEEGLGLDVARDRRTEEAFLRVLPLLAQTDVKTLKGRRLEAEDFDKLAVQDPVRDLLQWLDNPSKFETANEGARWKSFCGLCKQEFGLDPDSLPAAEVAGALLRAEPALDAVWIRFTESPGLYPGVAKLLREPTGPSQGALVLDVSRDPLVNDSDETELCAALDAAATLPHAKVCVRVLELEEQHGPRRGWVWASMKMSPWAQALRPLSRLAKSASQPIGGLTLTEAAAAYANGGWQTDWAAMEALGSIRNGAGAAVMARIVRTLYESWLDGSARHFQSLVAKEPDQAHAAVRIVQAEKDTCLLFVDGLRFDLAGDLAAQLETASFHVVVSHRMAPLPTVTATAKPAASPLGAELQGGGGEDFTPLAESKSGLKPLLAPLFRERLEAAAVEVWDSTAMRIPSGTKGGGWTECGSVDSLGHSQQGGLAYQLRAQVENVAAQVTALMDAGWRRVRVVTDHGWLLLPGGLPKVDLPAYLVETRWARCALVKGEPDLSVPVSAWHWNHSVRIASPPGIACFRAGETYAHGGISPQECVVPEILVERGAGEVSASIQSVEWRGMRCRVRVESSAAQVHVDIRTNWKQANSSIVEAKKVGAGGDVSLVVPDDSHEGAAASVVVLDPEGKVLAMKTTCVGEKA